MRDHIISHVNRLSLPSRERGLKSSADIEAVHKRVAPIAGAWIEISSVTPLPARTIVAPIAGAWIEIFLELYIYLLY